MAIAWTNNQPNTALLDPSVCVHTPHRPVPVPVPNSRGRPPRMMNDRELASPAGRDRDANRLDGAPACAARPGVAVDRGQSRRRRPLTRPARPSCRALTNIPTCRDRVAHRRRGRWPPIPSVQCNASPRAGGGGCRDDGSSTQLLLVDATTGGARKRSCSFGFSDRSRPGRHE